MTVQWSTSKVQEQMSVTQKRYIVWHAGFPLISSFFRDDYERSALIVNNHVTKVQGNCALSRMSPQRNSTLVSITIGNVYCFVSYGRCPGGSLVACCGISILKWLVSPLSPVWLGLARSDLACPPYLTRPGVIHSAENTGRIIIAVAVSK